MDKLFADRVDAGRQLAQHLGKYRNRDDVVVLALPRGGVPVASVVAKELNVPLDVLIVRKVGLPGNSELAMGAVASGNVEIANQRVVNTWGISPQQFRQVVQQELKEVERREGVYRRGREPLNLEGKLAVLVDDGIATGSTMKAGVRALRQLNVKSVIVAVPVSARETAQELEELADEVVVVETPPYFWAVGQSYRDFSQTSDREVCELLETGQQKTG